MPEDFEFRWSWRTLAALVYLGICVFDLVIMPLYREYNYTKMPVAVMVSLSAKMKDPGAQIEALKILKEDRSWKPITNDMFHLSFGAILGVSALPRNRRGSGFMKTKKPDPLDDEPEQPEHDDTVEVKGRWE